MKKKVIQFLFGVNVYEIVFDFILAMYVRFYLYGALLDQGRIIDRLNAGTAIILALAIDFFIPWYLGVLYKQYRNAPQFVRKTVLIVFGFIVFFLYVEIPANLYHYKIVSMEMHMMALFIGGLFALISGGMLGANENEPVEKDEPSGLGATVMMLIAPLEIFGIYLAILIGQKVGIFFGVIIWLGLTVGIALGVFWLSMAIDKLLKMETGQFLAKWGKNLILPFILSTLMCAWTEIYIWPTLRYSQESGGSPDHFFVVFTLILTGLLPLRLIMALHPPLRLPTLITGGGAFYFFIHSLSRLVDLPH
ncbi:MAG TPA: hypothetical protein PKW95_22065 [bacterium]|nr:hypothetical protein [bacterium]